MNGLSIVTLVLLSLTGLGYLAATDPKRRRIFKQSKLEERPLAWPARLATFGPGIYFISIGHWSGLSIWAGAVTTLGWAMVAVPPDRYAEGRAAMATARERVLTQGGPVLSRWLWGMGRLAGAILTPLKAAIARLLNALDTHRTNSTAVGTETIAKLEARIAELEARLMALETKSPAEPLPDAEAARTGPKPRAVDNLDAAE